MKVYSFSPISLLGHCENVNEPCPGNGFRGKDCKCYCRGNPIVECGDDTETGPDANEGTDLVQFFFPPHVFILEKNETKI